MGYGFGGIWFRPLRDMISCNHDSDDGAGFPLQVCSFWLTRNKDMSEYYSNVHVRDNEGNYLDQEIS